MFLMATTWSTFWNKENDWNLVLTLQRHYTERHVPYIHLYAENKIKLKTDKEYCMRTTFRRYCTNEEVFTWASLQMITYFWWVCRLLKLGLPNFLAQILFLKYRSLVLQTAATTKAWSHGLFSCQKQVQQFEYQQPITICKQAGVTLNLEYNLTGTTL